MGSSVQARSRGGRCGAAAGLSLTNKCFHFSAGPGFDPLRRRREGDGAGPSVREHRREQEQGGGDGLRKSDLSFAAVAVPQQQCYGHCPCDSAPAQQLSETAALPNCVVHSVRLLRNGGSRPLP